MCPIPHTSPYRPESKLLETDGDRLTMLRMGLVHARDKVKKYPILSGNVPLGTGTYYKPEQE